MVYVVNRCVYIFECEHGHMSHSTLMEVSGYLQVLVHTLYIVWDRMSVYRCGSLATWPASLRGFFSLCLPSHHRCSGRANTCSHMLLSVGCEDSNFCPHYWASCALPTEPYLQPHNCFCERWETDSSVYMERQNSIFSIVLKKNDSIIQMQDNLNL